MYNATLDTLEHQRRVRERILEVTTALTRRGINHDQSKHEEPEKSAIDRVRPQLKELDHGTPEYDALKREFSQFHYYDVRNRHHLEQHSGDIARMSLIDILEMLCDWKAATETHKEGDNIRESILTMCSKHDVAWPMQEILLNTAAQLGWLD